MTHHIAIYGNGGVGKTLAMVLKYAHASQENIQEEMDRLGERFDAAV